MAQTITTKPLYNIFCHLGRLPPPSYPSNKNKQKEGLYFIVFLEINNEIYVCLMSHSSAYVLATHAYTELGQIMKIKD